MLFAQKTALFFDKLYTTFFTEKCCIACYRPFSPHKNTSQHHTVLRKYLCPDCITKIPPVSQHLCSLCGHVFTQKHEGTVCLQCMHSPPPWDGLCAYTKYDNLLKKLLIKYKFSADFSCIPFLSSLLAHSCQALPPCDVCIPMPRHTTRLRAQGFNHVLELCRPLEKRLQTPLCTDSLQRTRFTAPQASLNATQRKNNPVRSFIAQNVQHKKILLIDDIMTTGATVHHASLALRQCGATKIYIALVAQVPRNTKNMQQSKVKG